MLKQLRRDGAQDEIFKMLERNDVYVSYEKMSLELWGIVYYNKFCEYHIAINDRLASNQQYNVLRHELKHIKNDLPEFDYVIGMNMQYTKLEQK